MPWTFAFHCPCRTAAISLITPAIVFLILLVLTGSLVRAADAEPIGYVRVVSGDVTIQRSDQAITAAAGAALFQGDTIRTGSQSAAGMTFLDNSRISLGPDSTIDLENFAFKDGGTPPTFDVRLNTGSLTAASGEIAKMRPLAMKVLMPTTVLGVRGTEFVVRVKPDG